MPKLTNFLRGSVSLKLAGAFPERLLNALGEANIPFWDARQPDSITLWITVPRSRLGKLRTLAKKLHFEVEEERRFGAPAAADRFRKRYGFLAGLLFAFFAVSYLSRLVLVVDVVGNDRVSNEVILQELRQAGLTFGAFGPAVQARQIANRVLLSEQRLCYVAVNLHGIRAEVIVREKDPVPEVLDWHTPSKLVATESGVICRMEVYSGVRLTDVGETVVKGDTLVTGEVVYLNPNTGAVNLSDQISSQGKLWARTWHTLSASAPLEQEEKCYTGREKTRYRLIFLGHSIKFYQNGGIPFDKYDRITTTKKLTLPGSLELPFGWVKTTCREYETTPAAGSGETLAEGLKSLLLERMETRLGLDGTITQADFMVQETEDLITVTLNCECEEQIALRVPLGP